MALWGTSSLLFSPWCCRTDSYTPIYFFFFVSPFLGTVLTFFKYIFLGGATSFTDGISRGLWWGWLHNSPINFQKHLGVAAAACVLPKAAPGVLAQSSPPTHLPCCQNPATYTQYICFLDLLKMLQRYNYNVLGKAKSPRLFPHFTRRYAF